MTSSHVSSIKRASGGVVVTSVGTQSSKAAHPRAGGAVSTVKAYIALTKPQIIELLLVTTAPTMVLAQRGMPPIWLMVVTLLGGAMAAGSANALNCYVDRDIDKVMNRTKNRPLATGEISPQNALIFAVLLGVASVLLLGFAVNWLASGLALSAILFYVFVYTLGLKRRTPSNIVWGGAAGCAPVLIGWAAVTGSLSWAPWVLFLVIFFWTPPHYWPLSMKYADDYSAVDVPMLGAIEEPHVVAIRIVRYTWVMVAVSLAMIPTGVVGWTYTVAAVVLGGVFLWQAYRLLRRTKTHPDDLQAMRLFAYSITYLTILFLAVMADPFLTPAPLM